MVAGAAEGVDTEAVVAVVLLEAEDVLGVVVAAAAGAGVGVAGAAGAAAAGVLAGAGAA